jgi:Rne/Rng family ribonuclease
MTREMFVSSTPHETKVGLVEDDQLAEVYLERENEYTLAGSIYKGRVTRVLPGMQSAFVDIGLERDAFLYVSDFMELENQEEDLDEIPATPVLVGAGREEPSGIAEASAAQNEAVEPASAQNNGAEAAAEPAAADEKDDKEDRGGWRNRRRRRGRRDRGGAPSESRYSRPESRPAEAPASSAREQYGPPPGYQPIILPGESISKYRNAAPRAPERDSAAPAADVAEEKTPATAEAFPDDEPVFTQPGHETEEAEGLPIPLEQLEYERTETSSPQAEIGSPDWDREQKRQHEMNVAAVFGAEEAAEKRAVEEHAVEECDDRISQIPEHSDAPPLSNGGRDDANPGATRGGTLEEEEIDEEEADLASYVEELEEDAAFEEMEEETRAAADYVETGRQEIAASGENGSAEVPLSAEPVSELLGDGDQSEEEADEAAEEAEIEEAQAEAEALLDSEGRENGTVEARAEVRTPAATAAYTQRAPRPAFDRDRGRGGRRFPRGRRFRRQQPQNLPQITDLLKEGQEILVQIAKEPIGKKGARITSHIALPGRFLVYMPTVNHTGVSRKIASEEERQRLKRIILSERENGHGGFIVRTAAQGADEQELRADIRFLKGLWTEIRTRAEDGKAPALIYHDLNVVERVLRDQVTSDFSAIWVDTEQEYERILRFANRFQPALVRRVKLYTKETPLFEQFGLKEEIDKALKSKVWLKSGGYIVINQTEALVAIDVNTGKYVGKTARLEDTIVKTNVDAIKEIVRQIRLRDLGGIIVIDFIDMDERRNRQKVMQALEEALRADRAPSKVLQFNDFGLVAITRKRVKQSLERTIGSPCPYCEATGFVKNVNTVCNEIYVEMRKISKHLEHADVMLRVNPEVAKALKANNGKWLNELEELTKKTVIVKSDPALHQEQFDIN